jgi:DNA modification methylase
MEYQEFLEQKQIVHKASGFEVLESDISRVPFPFQRASIRYALRKGKAALLYDTGLGKTIMEIEAANQITKYTDKPVLITMPLWVAYQTQDIAEELFNQNIQFAKDKMSIAPGQGVYVTNYEILHKFEGVDWGGLIFDESSIFKGDGKFFERAKKLSAGIPFVLCASATPSPNSIEEMGRQAEVLGIMTVAEMKATFFVNRQDKKKTDMSKGVKQKKNLAQIPFTELVKSDVKNKKKTRQGWELRPHAMKEGSMNFFKWLSSWAMAVKLPSDIGFSDEGYILPELTITPIFIEADYVPDNQLVFTGLGGVSDRSKVRKLTLEPKCQMAVELIGGDTDQWIVWCGLNPEANLMKKLLGDRAVNVQGSDKVEKKVEALRGFTNGETQILVSKTKICGHGSNFQNCHKIIFVGLSDSWESFYQAIKRIHRFGQTKPCEVYVILAEEEREIWENVERKGKEAELMTLKLIENAANYQKAELDMKASEKAVYTTDEIKTDQYHIMLGDSCEWMKKIKSSTVGLSVYSPPFEDLFVYSNSERDLGNSGTKEDFYTHYGYIAKELLRATIPGRKTVVHAADIHAKKNKDGFIGLIPFTHNVVKLYSDLGWDYNGSIQIAKNPQAAAIRLKAHELMFATMERDAARLMPVQPDYLLIFTKPGKNPEPILPVKNGELSRDDWIKIAGNTWLNGLGKKLQDDSLTEQDFIEIGKQIYEHYKTSNPIWQDIRETEVLPHKGKGGSRVDENDTKHICPLQLDPVERAIKLWSNPGDTVLDPFLGSGTTVYQAVMFGRYGVGIELKPEYFYDLAVKNIKDAVRLSKSNDLFSMAGIEV